MFRTPIRGPIGFKPVPDTAPCKNLTGSAVVVGQLVALDIAGVEAEVANSGEGGLAFVTPESSTSRGSRYGAAVDSGSAASWAPRYGIFGIALEAAADNAEFEVLIAGEVDALVSKGTGNVAEGDPLVAGSSNGELDADTSTGMKILGIAIEALTGPSTAALGRVLFNGWSGFGSSA